MKKTVLFLLAMVVVLPIFAADEADYYNPLLTGVPSLTITPDARAGGMGDVGVSTSPDMVSQHWNASKYPQMKSNGGMSFSYTPWLSTLGVNDIYVAYLSGYYRVNGVGTFSAALRYFSLGDVALKTSKDDIAMQVKPYEMAFDLGYSLMLSERLSMGVVLRYIASDLSAKNDPDYQLGQAFAADVSAYYQLPIEIGTGTSNLALGANISNLGTKISYDNGSTNNFLPANLRLGATYTIPFDDYNKFSISLETNRLMVPSRLSSKTEGFDKNDPETWRMKDDQYNDMSVVSGIFNSWNDAPDGFSEEMKEFNWSLGLEYAYTEQFYARAGYQHEADMKGGRKYYTAGVGFSLSAFTIDGAYVIATTKSNPLDQTFRLSLSFDMDGLKELVK